MPRRTKKADSVSGAAQNSNGAAHQTPEQNSNRLEQLQAEKLEVEIRQLKNRWSGILPALPAVFSLLSLLIATAIAYKLNLFEVRTISLKNETVLLEARKRDVEDRLKAATESVAVAPVLVHLNKLRASPYAQSLPASDLIELLTQSNNERDLFRRTIANAPAGTVNPTLWDALTKFILGVTNVTNETVAASVKTAVALALEPQQPEAEAAPSETRSGATKRMIPEPPPDLYAERRVGIAILTDHRWPLEQRPKLFQALVPLLRSDDENLVQAALEGVAGFLARSWNSPAGPDNFRVDSTDPQLFFDIVAIAQNYRADMLRRIKPDESFAEVVTPLDVHRARILADIAPPAAVAMIGSWSGKSFRILEAFPGMSSPLDQLGLVMLNLRRRVSSVIQLPMLDGMNMGPRRQQVPIDPWISQLAKWKSANAGFLKLWSESGLKTLRSEPRLFAKMMASK